MKTTKKLVIVTLFLSLAQFISAQQGIHTNTKAPLFEAQNQFNETVSLKEELKKGKVVLLFYRGEWCPYCNRHMSALQDSLHLITQKGATVIAITPEKGDAIEKTLKKSGASFSVIHDSQHAIMDAYDVTFTLSKSKHLMYKTYGININEASGNEDRALPVPATFIISENGLVISRHFDKDYKTRMSVKTIIQAL